MLHRYSMAYSTLIILMLVPVTLLSQTGTPGYIGLYTENYSDSLPVISSYCPFEGINAQVEMWIICRPNELGQCAGEFKIEYPDNVDSVLVTVSPDVCVIMGTLGTGIYYSYYECQTEWNCPFHQTLLITSHERSSVSVAGYPATGLISYADCTDLRSSYECVATHELNLNYRDDDYGCTEIDIGVEIESSSWGVIKRLCND